MESKGREAEDVQAGLSPFRIRAASTKNPFSMAMVQWSMANGQWLLVIRHPPFF
jgi:hypothetical protein